MKSTGLVVPYAVLFLATSSLFAQSAETGALVGTITDSTGAVIPNATVVATNADTGASRTVISGADGSYRFALLQPGAYNVKFSSTGFKAVEVARFAVAVSSTPVLDERLEVGTQAEQVTVEASATTIQASNATLGSTLGEATMTALPLTTRNYSNILALSAGVSAGVTNASSLGTAGMDMAVGGAATVSNNIQIDGANVQNTGATTGQVTLFGNGGYNPIPSPDALQEFNVQTANFDASYGRNIGANINVITKSGTNGFHGTLFEFFRNTDLNANDFFLNLNRKAKGVLNQNQFGGVFGGPIKKDRLFFFGSYQGTRQKNGVSPNANSAVILPPIPQGDRSNTATFRAALGALNCPANHAGANYSPVAKPVNGSGTPSSGVTVACDGSNISPEAIRLLQAVFPSSDTGFAGHYLFPGSTNGGYQNTNFSIPAYFNEDQYMANIDYVMSSKNTISNRFFASNAPAALAFVGANLQKAPGFTAPYLYRNWVDTFKLTTVASGTLVNSLRASFTRSVSNSNGNTGGISDEALGITPVSPALDKTIPGFMSALIISGAYVVGGGANGTDFSPENANTYQLSDQLSWTHGKHTIRAGGGADQTRWHWNMAGLGAGNLNISTFADFLIGRPGCTPGDTTCTPANPGNTNGTLYSNIASTSSVDAMGLAGDAHSFRIHDYAAFVADDYKISQRLTLNIGVRYEYDGLLSDDYGVLTNFWPSAIKQAGFAVPPTAPCAPQCNYEGFVVPANYPAAGVYGQTLANLPGMTKASNNSSIRVGPPKDIFGPRFGFAWQPLGLGKFVVRGGYGIFGDLPPGESLIFGVNNSPPLANAIGKAQQANYFSTLSDPFLPNQVGQFQNRWVNFATNQASNIGQQNFGEKYAQPLLQSWNMGVQYSFSSNWVLEVAYQGSRGTHIITGGTVDIGSLALLASPSHPVNGITTNTVANGVLRLPYLGYNSLRSQCTCFDSMFNSLQTTVRHTFSQGYQVQAAYTYARSFSDVQANQAWTTDLKGSNWGPDVNYHPHRLVISYSWNVPRGNLKGVAGKLLGGWSLSGVTTVQNGVPINITDTRAGAIFGNFTTNGSLGRAEIAPDKTYANIATPGSVTQRLGGSAGGCGYFTSYAASGSLNGVGCASLSPFMAIPNQVAPDGTLTNGTGWGNTGIGVILGPGQFNFDTALVKNTHVGGTRENGNLQFRAEFFNMMNHPQFANPAANLAVPGTFGQITATTVNPRLIQLALKYSF
jgi:hypothetical protein